MIMNTFSANINRNALVSYLCAKMMRMCIVSLKKSQTLANNIIEIKIVMIPELDESIEI